MGKSTKNIQLRISYLASFLIIILFLNSCSNNNYIIRNGKSDFSIFVSEQASQPEKYAAAELQKYLKEISGFELPVTHVDKSDAKMIYVGFDGAPESLLYGLKISDFENE